MLNPKEVYDNPLKYLQFLQSTNFEGQYFDRKEVKVDSNSKISDLKDSIKSCISAFANSNKKGGLVVIGITDDGAITGTQDVNEQKINNIMQVLRDLRGHTTETDYIELPNSGGKQLHFLYIHWTSDAICETISDYPKAWKRVGAQNQLLNQQDIDRLRREKRIVNFEMTFCCPYDPDELNDEVVEEFKDAFLDVRNSEYEDYSTEEILDRAGALIKINNEYAFTNAGYLFFTSNPRKRFGNAYVRVLRYDTNVDKWKNPGSTTLDKDFDGPLPNIVRSLRNFLSDSALFRTFTKRNANGGFTDEPEYPSIVVDEAIVNALVHRDYGDPAPISCIVYRDALVVKNPGEIQQSGPIPSEFSLDETELSSDLRNVKIVEWMRIMKDERGSAFVRALSEGTETMRREMKKLDLPAPRYHTGRYTTVTLFNDIEERTKQYAAHAPEHTREYTNLFPLEQSIRHLSQSEFRELRGNILSAIKDALIGNKWFIDSFSFGRIVAHRQGISLPLSPEVETVVMIYPAYEFQVRQYAEKLYLCIDYKAEIKNVLKIEELQRYITTNELKSKYAIASYGGQWERGRILDIDSETTKLNLFDLDAEVDVTNNNVIPSLTKTEIKRILREKDVFHNLDDKIREYSLLSPRNASKIRAEKTLKIAQYLSDEVFPVKVNDLILNLSKLPAYLRTPTPNRPLKNVQPFTVFHESVEPSVKFFNHKENPNIVEGLTKFSSYGKESKDIELIPICPPNFRNEMRRLIDRLIQGKHKYRGTERTFRTKLSYQNIIPVPLEEYESECRGLINRNPEWVGKDDLLRLFIVYVPENQYPRTDLNSPYYIIKELLFSKGIPVQMVDTDILKNPDWKDLNLALNITAKCGVIPWVLPDKLPDADFFVGLSYTQHPDRKIDRHMAFANVFSNYGRWQFYQGNAKPFNYDERHEYYKDLVRLTMERLDLPESPSIHFHYSAKFSKEDRAAILEAAQSICPNGKYTFVWINSSHIVRFYDPSPQTDGSLHRGTYVIGTPNQFYLSTTGYNSYQKALGTPRPLEVNVWTEPYDSTNPADLKVIAKQLIYLTKLNWASTRSFCGTPITIKYARDIARFASAFIERNGKFELHEVLEKTPWFI